MTGVAGYLDFCIGIQLIDNNQKGPALFTPWASQGMGNNGWTTGFAFDADRYDPDGIAIGLILPQHAPQWVNRDFRLGIGAVDLNEGKPGAPQYTPWMGETLLAKAKEGVAQPASDLDSYDPDGFAVGLLASPMIQLGGRVDFHLEVRVIDRVGPGLASFEYGDWQRTPTNNAGGGWTKAFAFDKDQHDPDYMQLKFVIDGYWPM